MERKQIIITGGHSGIGLELTKLVLKENHRVGLILRNENTLGEAKKIIKQFNPADVDFFIADLSDQESISAVAKSITDKWYKVDILFNNAGVLLREKMFSIQQNEMHNEINTLAPHILTIALHQALINAEDAIVVNTATDGLNMMKKLKMEELINPMKFKKLLGSYLHSKLALVLLMNNLAMEWQQQKIRILNVSPGGNKTKLSMGSGMPSLLKPIVNLFYKNPIAGAKLLYEAGFGEKFKENNGVFIQNNKIEKLKVVLGEEQKSALLKGIKTHVSR
ncbi:MAG: SDR family NAD(P)-dependent oxidoreductase [Bacteroidota bacterium]